MFYSEELLMSAAGFTPVTFTANGTWTVPHGIKQIAVDCVAAQGYSTKGGKGGRVQCILDVTPKQLLYIIIGIQPNGSVAVPYNASDIRTIENDLNSRLVVAGGGGSFGADSTDMGVTTSGGHGGGLTGGSPSGTNVSYRQFPSGGTQTSGGQGSGYNYSIPLSVGTFGFGGPTVNVSNVTVTGSIAGAGGAGWYGGGGGFFEQFYGFSYCISGAGGSSYTHPTLCSNVVHTQGYRAGSGYVTISMV